MDKIVVDDTLIAKLGGLQVPLTLCNQDGKPLARISPVYDRAFYDALAETSPNDAEELARRDLEGGGRPLPDILSDLRSSTGS